MNDYIALTALETHWREPENTRFIGEWCKVDTRQHIWNAYNTEVLSRRWLTPEECESGIAYVVPLGKQLAGALGQRLEQRYSLGMDLRFYSKMLVPWALNFTSVLYDRYLAIKDAVTAAPSALFLIGHNSENVFPAYNLISFMHDFSRSDKNNLQLFSLIVDYLGIPCESVFCRWEQRNCSIEEQTYVSKKERLYFTAFYELNKLLRREFYVVNSLYHHVPRKELLKKTRFKLLNDEIRTWPGISVRLDERLRGQPLEMKGGGSDEFVSLLAYCAPRYLPWGLGEGMPEHIEAARNHPAIHARGFLSCFIPYTNLPAQYISVLSNAPIAMYSHAGSFTNNAHMVVENAYCDIHFDYSSDFKRIPNPSFYKQENNYEFSMSDDNALLILTTMYRYILCIGFSHSLFKDLTKDIFTPFLKEVAASIPLTVRPFLHTYGWEFVDWEKQFSHITVQNPATMPFAKAMAQAKIIIAPCCWFSKVAYDALACNKPVILVQREQIQSILPDSERIIAVLEEAGILYTDPKLAAQKLNAVYGSVDEWWQSDAVQKARNTFVDAVCPSAEDWERKWLRALMNMSGAKKKTTHFHLCL